MSKHPSLSAEFVEPTLLRPAMTMEPYVPCWCMSGKKWKFCHKHRESKEPVPLGRIFHDMHRFASKGYCSHPLANTGCGKVINAHTIQRQGGLSRIAEDGHVYSVKEGFRKSIENEGPLELYRIGARNASTFAGFCGVHDAELFAPVERKAATLNRESIFLLSFRAVAYEKFHKQISISSIEAQRQLDYGQPFPQQVEIQTHLHLHKSGMQRGLQDINNWKSHYDLSFVTGDYSTFRGYACLFNQVLPVACCGAFHPEVSFSGEPLQKISRGDADFEHIAVALTPVDGRTLLTMGWYGADGGPGELFAKSYAALDAQIKSSAAIHLAFEHMENTYCTPSWWDSIAEDARNRLKLRLTTGIGIGLPERSLTSLTELEPVLSGAVVEQELMI